MAESLADYIERLEKLRAEAAANREAAKKAVEDLQTRAELMRYSEGTARESLSKLGSAADTSKREMIASAIEMLARHVNSGDGSGSGLADLFESYGYVPEAADASPHESFQAPSAVDFCKPVPALAISAEMTISGCRKPPRMTGAGPVDGPSLPAPHANWESASLGCDLRLATKSNGEQEAVFVPTAAPGSLLRARVRAWQQDDRRPAGERAAPFGQWERIPLPEGSFAGLYRIGPCGLLEQAAAVAAEPEKNAPDTFELQSTSGFQCAHEARVHLKAVLAMPGSALLSPEERLGPDSGRDGDGSAGRAGGGGGAGGAGGKGAAGSTSAGGGGAGGAGGKGATGNTSASGSGRSAAYDAIDLQRSHFDVAQVDWEESWAGEGAAVRRREALRKSAGKASSSGGAGSSVATADKTIQPPKEFSPPPPFGLYPGPYMLKADLRIPASSPGTYVVLFAVPEACDVPCPTDAAGMAVPTGSLSAAGSDESPAAPEEPQHPMYTTADSRLRHGWRVAGASLPFEVVPRGASPQRAIEMPAVRPSSVLGSAASGGPSNAATASCTPSSTSVSGTALEQVKEAAVEATATPMQFTLEARPLTKSFSMLVRLPMEAIRSLPSAGGQVQEPDVSVNAGRVRVRWRPGGGDRALYSSQSVYLAAGCLPSGYTVATAVAGDPKGLGGNAIEASSHDGTSIQRVGGFAPSAVGPAAGPRWEALNASGNRTEDLTRMRYIRVTGFFEPDDDHDKGDSSSSRGQREHDDEEAHISRRLPFVPLQFRGDAELEDVATAAARGGLRCRLCGCGVMDAGGGCDRAVRLLAGSDTHDRTNVSAARQQASPPAEKELDKLADGNATETGGPYAYGAQTAASVEARGVAAAGAVAALGAQVGGAGSAGAGSSGWLGLSTYAGSALGRPHAGAMALTSDLGLSRRLGMWVCAGLEYSAPVVSRGTGGSDGETAREQPLAVLGLLASSARRGFVGVGQHELLVHPLDTGLSSASKRGAASGSCTASSGAGSDPGETVAARRDASTASADSPSLVGTSARPLQLHPWAAPETNPTGKQSKAPGQAREDAVTPCWLRCGMCDEVLGHCLAPSTAVQARLSAGSARLRPRAGAAPGNRVPYRELAETWLDSWQAGRQPGPEGEPAGLMPGGAAPLAGRLFKHALVCAVKGGSNGVIKGGKQGAATTWRDAFECFTPSTLLASAAGASSADPADDVARSALGGAGLEVDEAAQRERGAIVAAVDADAGRVLPLADVRALSGGSCVNMGLGATSGWTSAAPVAFRLLREWSIETLPEVRDGRLVFLPPAAARGIVSHLRRLASRLPPALRGVSRAAAPLHTDESRPGPKGRAGGVWQTSWIIG